MISKLDKNEISLQKNVHSGLSIEVPLMSHRATHRSKGINFNRNLKKKRQI